MPERPEQHENGSEETGSEDHASEENGAPGRDEGPPGSRVAVDGLPEEIRTRAVLLASEALGVLPVPDVPAQLRRIRAFEPRRRATRGGHQIAAVMAVNEDFREKVAEWLRDARPRVAAVLADSTGDEAARPAGEVLQAGALAGLQPPDVAAAAFFLRPRDWEDVVEAAAEGLRERRAFAQRREADARVKELQERDQREAVRQRLEIEKLRIAQTELQRDRDRWAAEAAEWRGRTRRLQEESDRAVADASEEGVRLSRELTAAQAELTRLRRRVEELERLRREERRVVGESRAEVDMRLWLLVEAAFDAVSGLRRELGLPAPEGLPADLVAAGLARGATGRPGWLTTYDTAALADLLRVPRVHLVVDGYNVTMSAYGELTLEEQRGRLVAGLAALAARTGAEVTCVFDGGTSSAVPAVFPRSVKVIFSGAGEIADQIIREIVEREPSGRTVVVVSSDREVADHALRHGFHAVPSDVLASLLQRT